MVCRVVLSSFTLFFASMTCLSEAASYPEQDISFVVPAKPGGGNDTQARILAPFIKKYLPKQVNIVIENQPAAGGKVAMLKVFEAKPNGYTIGILSAHGMSVLAVKGETGKIKLADLVYLCRVVHAPYMLTLSSRSRFKNIGEMKGQQVKFGGTASSVFQSAMLAQELGAKMVYVTYDGVPEAAMAIMRGDVDVGFSNWDSGIKHVEASEGRLKAVFIAAENRLPQLPNLPTVKEAGLAMQPEVLSVMATENVVLAPAGLSPDVRETLERAVQKAVNDPEVEKQMRQANYFVSPLSPKETKEGVLRVSSMYVKHKEIIDAVK